MKKKLKKRSKKQWLLWGGLLFLLLFFVLNHDSLKLLLYGDVEKIRIFLHNNSEYALIFMALIMLIQNSFTVFPLILVITINVTLFGFLNGFLWSWFTSMLSAVIVFYGARYILQDMVIEKFNSKLLKKIDTSGFAYVFQARIFPFVPTSLVNILGGLSTIRVLPYFIATAIGNFLYFFVLALIPAGILKANFNEYIIWVVILAAVLLYYFIKMVRRKRKDSPRKVDTLD